MGFVLDLRQLSDGRSRWVETVKPSQLELAWPGLEFGPELRVQLDVGRTGNDLDLALAFTGDRRGECDRCLKPFEVAFKGSIRAIARRASADHELAGQDGVIFHDGLTLDLTVEVREAVLANTMLAKLAGDVAQFDADKTMIFGVNSRVTGETPPHLPGRTIGRRIGLGRYVGSYTATHLATKREEVVKVLRSNELPPGFMAAYLEQYRKVAGINQRNVVSVYETGETTSGAYVALEYLPGGSLSEAIRNKLPVGHALNCLAEMCLALDAVHGTGICHGALRAEHFLFRPDGVLVLTDFNVTERISDSMGLAHPASDRIRSGRGRVSTPRVCGPEMDFRAVGRIFYAMLTGDVAPLQGQSDNQSTGDPSEGVRLPLALSPLQRCLDGLLGAAPGQPGERAEHVLMELLALKEVFPFDIPRGEAGELRQASKRIGG